MQAHAWVVVQVANAESRPRSVSATDLSPVRCRCGLTDETCAELTRLVNLTHLDLRYCKITNAGMARLSPALPNLEYCNVEGCRLTCLGMMRLLQRHKRLRVWGPG